MIFKSVRYFLPHSLTAERREELTKVLNANGGEEATSLDVATHVITNSHVFEGYQNVSENVAVVTDFWVDRSVVLGKAQNVKIYSADPVKIFSGVTACTSEIATSDQEIIAAGLNGLGGLYREGFTRDCTHLIVPRPGSTKYDTGIQLKNTMQMRVVVPQWFDDCFQQMLHLPEEPYEWPDPEILRSSNVGGDPAKKKSVIPKPRRDLIRTALETLPEGDEKIRIEKLTAKSIPNVWAGRKILLSRNLDVEHVMEFVKTSIKRGGGVLIDLDWSQAEDDLEEEELSKVSDADIYVTQYRAGRAYLKALKENKTIGSLAWLFHVQQTGTIVRPEDHLLHYPRRNQKIPGFDTHVMTISNYSDDARAYLKRLIVLMGGEFTADMNQHNTIVVAAYISGKKTEKAREWDIPIVNHTWLEDCFVAWRALTPAQEKYITFPQGLSFAKLVAQRGVGRIGFDVASPAEIAAIEAEVEVEMEGRRKRRGDNGGASEEVVVKEEKDVKKKKKAGEPVKATEASQNEAREVEVLMDLDEVPPADDFPVQEIESIHADDEVEEEEKDVRKRSPSPLSSLPVSPVKKKRGKPKKAQLVSADEDEEESQPRTVFKTNNKSSAAGSSKKVKKAAQSETEAELEEVDPPRRPEPPKKKAGSSKTTRSRGRSDPESEDDGEIEEIERPTAKAKPAKPAAKSRTENGKSKGKFKEKNAASAKRIESDVIDLSDDNEEEEEPESEPYPTRRQTRSLTSSPTKNATAAPISKVPTTSFYGSSPKKPAAVSAPSPKKVASPKTKKTTAKASTSSRMDEMMQELESSDSDADLQFSPFKSTDKGKEKATAPTKKPPAARARSRTDDEEEEEEGKASANASRDEEQVRKKRESHAVTRIGPPKAKTKNGPLATSTPLRKAPHRNENTDESSPTHGLVVEVEIESQESPPVAGPSRIRGGATTKATAVAAEMISASPERARPSKKRPRSPSPPPAPTSRPPSPDKQRKNATVAKSQTPSSLSERDQQHAQVNGVGGRPPGRQAKALAAAKLKDDVSDANSYAKEIKSGRIRGAWEKELPKENNSKGKGKATAANSSAVVKRRASAASSVKETEDDEEGGDETGKSSNSKKRKLPEDEDSKGGKKKARFKEREESMSVGAATTENDERLSGKGIKFMTTGVQLDEKVVDGLDKLGIKETKVPNKCTHLIVKSIMRTEKFLFALANAPCIVSKDWALDCARTKRVLPTDKYLLHDPEGEAKHGLNLEETLERARFQKGKLFLHHAFYLTPNIPNYSTVKKVIQAHSGKPYDCKKSVKVEELKKDKDCRHVISCQEDRAVWEPLGKQGYPIFSVEAVYKAVFRQKMNWSDETVQVQVGM